MWTETKDSSLLPRRATEFSAGYDFFFPDESLHCEPGEEYEVNTTIHLDGYDLGDGDCLILLPKSGLGFNYGFQFVNTIGLVDGDYHGAIRCKFTVRHPLDLVKGQKFMQGIIVHYKTFPEEKAPVATRNGGFGSTGMF